MSRWLPPIRLLIIKTFNPLRWRGHPPSFSAARRVLSDAAAGAEGPPRWRRLGGARGENEGRFFETGGGLRYPGALL